MLTTIVLSVVVFVSVCVLCELTVKLVRKLKSKISLD